jgi:hypothetical protein
MNPMRTLLIVAAGLAFSVGSHAEAPAVQSPHHHEAGSTGEMDGAMVHMDAQIKLMHDMHVKMTAAKTPAERNALMAEHMKTMQSGMDMMSGMMAKDDMAAMDGMPGMGKLGDSKAPTPEQMAKHHSMMKKHMQMKQKHMQMMHSMMH